MQAPAVYCVVIVERAGEGTVQTWARVIADALQIEDKREEAFELTTFRDRPAVRVQSFGRAQGIEVRFQHLVFLNEGHLYQIVAWGLAGFTNSDGRTLRPAVNAISLLEGKVHRRGDARQLKDSHGVGWQVRSGRFAHAAYGFAVEPVDEWRIVLGDELAQMNSDASVGMVHENEDAYFVLISERASGVDRRGFEKLIRNNIAEENEALPDPVTMTVAGVPVVFDRYRLPQGMILLHGVLVSGDIYHQIQAWFFASSSAEALAALPKTFSAVSLLDAAERERLREELAAAPDPTNHIGPGFSFRQGVYRDFDHAFTWKRPAGTWRVMVGDEARQENSWCCLAMDELEAGLTAQVIAEEIEDEDFDAEDYHSLAIENLALAGSIEEQSPPVESELGGVKGLTTELQLKIGDVLFGYTATTVVTSSHAYQLMIWGTVGNAAASPGAILSIQRGFQLYPGGLKAIEETDGRYLDHRVGFALSYEPGDVELTSIIPEAVQGLGNGILCKQDEGSAGVFGICALHDQQDAIWFEDLLKRVILVEISKNLGADSEESSDEFAGLPCRRITWLKSDSELLVCFVLQRDRTFFAYFVSGRDEAAIVKAKQRLRFLP